jgi:acyl-coenzyme A thioesterase PaaI-like protein
VTKLQPSGILHGSYVFTFVNTVSVMLLVENIKTVGKGMFPMLTSFGRTVTTMGYFTYIMYPIIL